MSLCTLCVRSPRAMASVVMAVAVVSLTTTSRADIILGTLDFSGTGIDAAGGGLGNPITRPVLSYGDPLNPASTGFLGNQTITFLDVANGTPKTLSGDFSTFATLVTNGVNNPFSVGFTVDGGTGQTQLLTEASWIPAFAGVVDPDFQGYTITRVVVLGTSFQSGSPGFQIGYNFTIFGDPIPGPATCAALAPAGLIAFRRRRRG